MAKKEKKTWLYVIGVDEDGVESLSSINRRAALDAELVIGRPEHINELDIYDEFNGKTMPWPSPFLDVVPVLKANRGRDVTLLATGDPLWYGAASTLLRYFDAWEMHVEPAASGFQLAAARMRWPMDTVECITVHGRSELLVYPHLAPKARLLVIPEDADNVGEIASLVGFHGFPDAVVTALGHLGSGRETRVEATAKEWMAQEFYNSVELPDFVMVAIECPAVCEEFHPRVPGLPEDCFHNDGNITKSEVRAATLARLAPHPGGVLWDLGCGTGSVGIEWMRAARGAKAIGVDKRISRVRMSERSSLWNGVPGWEARKGTLPEAVRDGDLPDPDAVFIGGGLSRVLVEAVLPRLPVGGRLVANAVTLESEELLLGLWSDYGGDLVRISVSRADPVGRLHGWRPHMPVTQWSLVKPKSKRRAKPRLNPDGNLDTRIMTGLRNKPGKPDRWKN